jgi:hypothetical protein
MPCRCTGPPCAASEGPARIRKNNSRRYRGTENGQILAVPCSSVPCLYPDSVLDLSRERAELTRRACLQRTASAPTGRTRARAACASCRTHRPTANSSRRPRPREFRPARARCRASRTPCPSWRTTRRAGLRCSVGAFAWASEAGRGRKRKVCGTVQSSTARGSLPTRRVRHTGTLVQRPERHKGQACGAGAQGFCA